MVTYHQPFFIGRNTVVIVLQAVAKPVLSLFIFLEARSKVYIFLYYSTPDSCLDASWALKMSFGRPKGINSSCLNIQSMHIACRIDLVLCKEIGTIS
jgi:hypothetical protein